MHFSKVKFDKKGSTVLAEKPTTSAFSKCFFRDVSSYKEMLHGQEKLENHKMTGAIKVYRKG